MAIKLNAKVPYQFHGAMPFNFTSGQKTGMQYFNFKFKAMGTPCEIQIFAEAEKGARDASNRVINDVNRLEAL